MGRRVLSEGRDKKEFCLVTHACFFRFLPVLFGFFPV